MSFAENLKTAMKARGVLQRELAWETGSSQALISEYEKGISLPRWYRAIDIADVLEVSLDWLFDRDYTNMMPMENASYGTIIRDLEDVCEISEFAVFQRLEINKITSNKIRHSEDVNMKTIISLADFFDVSLDFLAGRGKQEGI